MADHHLDVAGYRGRDGRAILLSISGEHQAWGEGEQDMTKFVEVLADRGISG